MVRSIAIRSVHIGGGYPLVVIAGPCVIESEEATLKSALELNAITRDLGIPFIFKASYDKANRTSINSYRGPGLHEGLRILREVQRKVGVPILSDIHQPSEVEPAGEVLDIIQIPAFLCRQTDLLVKAACTGKAINVKKGQFLAPRDMKSIIEKLTSCDNPNILLTERGTTFGYHNLVVDMRSLVIMRTFGFPIIFDATHSVQLPGAQGTCSGGEREFVPALARAASAVGIDGLYMEVHENPERALCDGPNSLRFSEAYELLKKVKALSALAAETG
jgi:2-dehydro-3-deoxyphosphooctonate aldolase (KDO 8-P synthase)